MEIHQWITYPTGKPEDISYHAMIKLNESEADILKSYIDESINREIEEGFLTEEDLKKIDRKYWRFSSDSKEKYLTELKETIGEMLDTFVTKFYDR